jgi:large subunit ribosomal protein L3
VTKALKGHYEKANVLPRKRIKESAWKTSPDYEAGKEITCAIFEEGDKVDISAKARARASRAISSATGQHRGPMKHGSKYHRAVGSMGASSSPSRVFKGKKLPGHMAMSNARSKI